MLALFNKMIKKGEHKQHQDDEAVAPVHIPPEPKLDDDALRRNIAAKLQNYRPVEREANFTGPKFFS